MGTVNFTCVVVGGRTPVTIQWLVDGEVFTGDSHSVIKSVNETASLLVIGIDNGASVEQDLKYYACQVSNSVGSFAAFTQLSRCGEVVTLLTNLCTAFCFWNSSTHYYQIYNSIIINMHKFVYIIGEISKVCKISMLFPTFL